MATVKLVGLGARTVFNLRSVGPLRLITITLVQGQDLPPGDLVARATRLGGGNPVELFPDEIILGNGATAVLVVMDPDDFTDFGNATYLVRVFVEDDASDPTRSILFESLCLFREVPVRVIQSTTITDIEASS